MNSPGCCIFESQRGPKVCAKFKIYATHNLPVLLLLRWHFVLESENVAVVSRPMLQINLG